jgi:hypothetical protein
MTPWLAITARDPSVSEGARSWSWRAVSPGDTGVAFDLPAPVTWLEPAEGAAIDADTVFRWSGGPPGGKSTLHLLCERFEAPSSHFWLSYWAEASGDGTEARLSSIPDTNMLGAHCSWSVWWETVRTYGSVPRPVPSAGEYRGSESEARNAVHR